MIGTASDQLFQQLFIQAPIMQFIADESGVIRLVSKRWLEKLGYHEVEVLNCSCLNFVSDQAKIKLADQPSIFPHDADHIEGMGCEFVSKSREIVEAQVNAQAFDFEGKRHWHVVIKDITSLSLSRRQVEANQYFLRSSLDGIQDGIAIVDMEGEHLLVNPAFTRMLGYTEAEIKSYKRPHPYWAEDSLPLIEKVVAESLAGATREIEVTLKRKDGSLIPILGSSSVIRTTTGEPSHIVLTIKDISHIKVAQEQLIASEKRFELAMDAVSDGMFDWDMANESLFLSNNFRDLLGIPPDRQLKDWSDLTVKLHPEDQDAVALTFEQHLKGIIPKYEIHHRLLLPDGAYYWFSVKGHVSRDVTGNPYRFTGSLREIHRQKVAELKLKESEERFKAIFEQSGVGIFLHSLSGVMLEANQSLTKMLGFQREEVIGESIFSFHPPEYVAGSEAALKRLLEDREALFQAPLIKQDGSLLYAQIFAKIVVIKGEEMVQGVVRDISLEHERGLALQASQEELKATEQRFRSIFNATFQLMGLLKPDGVVIEANQTALDFAGITHEEVVGKFFWECHWFESPATQETLKRNIELAAKGKFIRYHVEVLGEEGQTAITDFSLKPVFDEDGQVIMIIPEGRDITLQKEAEEALRKREEKYRFIVENTQDLISVHHPSGVYLDATPSSERLLGYKPEELIGRNAYDFFHPEDIVQIQEKAHQVALDGLRDNRVKYRIRRKDGTYIWFESITEPLLDTSGAVFQLLITSRDITQAEAQRRELVRKETQFRKLVEGSPDPTVILGQGGYIEIVSEQVLRTFGYEAEELNGKPLQVLLDPDTVPTYNQLLNEWHKNRTILTLGVEEDLWGMHKSNRTFPVEIALSPLESEYRTFVIAVIRDISDRKEAEMIRQRYRVLEHRNQELEQFAFIASHDLQAPLRTISNYTSILEEEYGDQFDEVAQKSMSFMVEATQRMSELIKDLLTYSRLGRGRTFEQVDCRELVNMVIQDLGHEIKSSGATIHVASLPKLQGLRTELRLLFQNLIGNALKFKKPELPPEIYIEATSDKLYWQFSVRDNGIGISPKHFDRIFQIFQRLHKRNAYNGTGIGLAHCKKIVELHKGQISVQSTEGDGSTFMFTILKTLQYEPAP